MEFKDADKADIYRQLYQNQNDKYFRELIKLVSTFISLLKANKRGLDEISKLMLESKEIKSAFQRSRTRLFLKVVSGAYDYYSDYLLKTEKIDFHDMINNAADIISSGDVKLPYRYIVVDEFQDTSVSRYNLVKAIKENNKTKLFCVGDD